MTLIEWNCQGAFRKKHHKILAAQPDLLIVPECENEKQLQFEKLTPVPADFFWYGDTPHKGIGIFSYSDYRFELLECFNPEFRYIVPLRVTGSNQSFLLFAIWAMDNKENPEARYIAQVWLALQYYADLLDQSSLFIGDFNSNQIWDTKRRLGNHTDVVNVFKSHDIVSLYHEQHQVAHGKEEEHSFFMYRKKEKPYHIDYCFASADVRSAGYNLQLGQPNEWLDQSDHVPLFIKLNLP